MAMINNRAASLEEYAREIIPLIIEESETLHAASPFQIMSSEKSWELIDTPILSVRDMSDKELKQSIIADLCNVEYWKNEGKEIVMYPSDLTRHIDDISQKIRISDILQDAEVQHFVKYADSGAIMIDPAKYNDAQVYCGVFNFNDE